MSRAASIPAASALVCESCGYTLTGVPPTGNCPECGTRVADSLPGVRQDPAWEVGEGVAGVRAWLATSTRALFRPASFFRFLSVPGNPRRSRAFRRSHQAIAALLLGLASWVHASKFGVLAGRVDVPVQSGWALLVIVALAYAGVAAVTLLVVRLTVWEAGYRGLRLPRPVVDRALDYHAVHLLPPAAVGLATVLAYAVVERRAPLTAAEWVMPYLYAIAAEVIVAAFYLFTTYWAAMRKLMYANRQGTSVEGGSSTEEGENHKVQAVQP